MKTNAEQFLPDLKKLIAQGNSLHNAMQNEQFPERMQEHIHKVVKQDYLNFIKALPSFVHSYQAWYSEAQALIKLMLPDRLADFTRLYEQPKMKKEIKPDNYVIEDYLKQVVITAGFDKSVVAGPDAAIPAFQQQLQILQAVNTYFESTLHDLRLHIQADLFDAELASANLLLKNKQYRVAGVIGGLILEKYLAQVCQLHNLKPKRNASVSDHNDLLKKTEVYDFYTWRYTQGLHDLIKLGYATKGREPVGTDIATLLDGTAKVIKMIF